MRLRNLMLWGALLSQGLLSQCLTTKQDRGEECLPLEEYGKPDPATGKPAPTSDNLFQQ